MIRDAYVAIADPTRRPILDLLRESKVLNAGDIASQFGAKSRPAVSRHLRILRECGVVTAIRQGKSQKYVLNAEAISAIRDGWMKGFGDRQNASLRSLRARVENHQKS